jgi:anti-sigma B factor antagonist
MLRGDTSSSPQPMPTAFEISQQTPDAQTSVVSVEGELALATAPQLKWTLIDALKAGHNQLVVDLSETTFMDSTALGVLIGVNRSLDVGARLAIVCTRSNVLMIFELSGMDGAFEIFPTLDEALAYVRGQTDPGS